MIVTEDAVFA